MKVRVVNGGRFVPQAVYVGRPTRWGNPFRVREAGSHAEAVRRYEAYFRERLKHPKFREALEALYGRLRRTGTLTLSCHCAPRPCHGEVIARWLAERGREEGYEVRVEVEGR